MRATANLLDLGCRRSHYICRSCLLTLPKLSAPLAAPSVGSSLGSSRFFSRRAARPAPRRPRNANVRSVLPLRLPPLAQPTTQKDSQDDAKDDDDDNVSIKYFEMDAPGLPRRQLRDRDEFVESFTFRREADAEIEAIESKLKRKPMLRGIAERLGIIAPRDQSGADGGETAQDDVEDDELDTLPFMVDSSGMNTRHARCILQLNWQLQRTARKIREGNVKQKTVYDSWRRYSLARPVLRNAWSRIPPDAWSLLWKILSWEGPVNTNRMSRVHQIGKDMRAAGIQLGPAQQLLHIEATFIEGARNEALEAWRRFAPDPADQPLLEEYLQLGVRMYSIHGDLDRASRVVDRALESSPSTDPRFLFSFIRACCATAIENGGASSKVGGIGGRSTADAAAPIMSRSAALDTAWSTYRRLRELLGEEMRIEDYDEVVSCFLLAGETESALHVFVDMMFSGAIDLHGRTRLPTAVANHFFLGKWLKRLIGAGDLDGALKVLRFMQAKGIMAAKIQVNGLIGAWIRSGTAENLEKAEQLGWAMIQSRLMFVDLRRRESLLDWPVRLLSSAPTSSKSASTSPSPPPPHKVTGADSAGDATGDDGTTLGLTFVPQASLETFSLLAENYRERRLHVRMERLWVAFQDAEIATDAFMMNQLLESYTQEGEGARAREVYAALTENHSLTPDAYTFFALYKTLAVNRLYWSAVTDEIRDDEARLCRSLFREMVSCSWAFESETIREALARMVLHSFRKCNDNVGFLVALRALRDVFGCSPDQVTSAEMLAETPDLRHSERRMTELAKQLRAMLDSSRSTSPAGTAGGGVGDGIVGLPPPGNVGGGTAEVVHRKREAELVLLVEKHYKAKIDVPEQEFQAMYQEAVEEMGLADIFG